MTIEQKKAASKRMKRIHRISKASSNGVVSNDLALSLLKTVVKLLGGKS